MGEGDTGGARDGVLSPVSSADSSKTSKLSSATKDNRVFERLSVLSIQYFAESLGYDTHFRKFLTILSSDALCALTEDVNYRLRELANKAALFMRQRRGEKLVVDDLNAALKLSGATALLGHHSREPPRLHFLKDYSIFAPNEGIVDATTLSLSKFALPPPVKPILTGHLFIIDHVADLDSQKVSVMNEELNAACDRLLRQCTSCRMENFHEYLVGLGQAASIGQKCALALLNRLMAMINKAPRKARLWRCLQETIERSDFSRSVGGLSTILQLAETVHDSILGPSSSSAALPQQQQSTAAAAAIDDEILRIRCLIMVTMKRRYDFVSSVSYYFDRSVFRNLQQIDSLLSPPDRAVRILYALLSSVDSRLVFRRIDAVISQFQRYVDNHDDNGPLSVDLRFAWKDLISHVLRICLSQLPACDQNPSLMDVILSSLLPPAVEAYGDAIVIPLLSLSIIDRGRKSIVDDDAKLQPSSQNVVVILEDGGNEFLEQHWNRCRQIRNGSPPQDEKNTTKIQGKVAASRKKKRRREPSDVFAYPKRLRLTHQRDVIFVFHHTAAIVRPIESAKPATTMTDRRNRRSDSIAMMNETMNKICGRIFIRRRGAGMVVANEDRRFSMPPPIIDICTIVM